MVTCCSILTNTLCCIADSFATAGVGTEIYRPVREKIIIKWSNYNIVCINQSVTDDAEVYAIGSIRSEGSGII